MRIVDGGSPAPTFWNFVLSHDNFKPIGLAKDTVCLELIRHKDGSIVSISRISEVIVSNCSSLMLRNLQLYNSLNEKNVTLLEVKIYSDLSYIFSGGQDPQPRGSTPLDRCL